MKIKGISSIQGISLSTRMTFGVVLLLAVVIGLTVYFAGVQQRSNLYQDIGVPLTERAHQSGLGLKRGIINLDKEVRFLSDSPLIQGIARPSPNKHPDADSSVMLAAQRKELQKLFSSFIEFNQRDYFQVRLVGVADNGQELVRVELRDGKPFVVPADQLQAEGDSDYFRAALKLKAGQVYLSEISLAQEHGKIAEPHIPTLRAAAPIYAPDGKPFGLVVVSLNAAPVFERLYRGLSPGVLAFLMNDQGDYLIHPDSRKAFGFDLGQRYRWQVDYQDQDIARDPMLAKADKLLELRTVDGPMYVAYNRVHFDPVQPRRFLTVAYALPDSVIQERVQASRRIALTVALGTGLILVVLFHLFVHFSFSPLRQLSTIVRRIGHGNDDTLLPKETSGELGEFVRAFSEMLDRLRQRDQKVRDLNVELEAKEQMANTIIDTAPEAIVVVDNAGCIARVNTSLERMFGYEKHELIGQPVELLVPERYRAAHPDLRQRYSHNASLRMMGHGRDLHARRKDGSEFDVEVGLGAMQIGNQQFVIAALADVSRRKVAERALQDANSSLEARVAARTADLRASEERYRRVLENVDEIVYMVEMTENDPWAGGQVMFVSSHVQNLIGYGAEEFAQDPTLWSRLIHPDDCAALEAQTLNMFANRRATTRHYRLRHKRTGDYRWMEDHVLPQFDAQGRLTSLFGVARDITERMLAEIELRKLSSAVEQTADSVIITNSEGVIEYVNAAFEATTGYTRAEALGKKPDIVKSGKHARDFYEQLWKTLRRGEPFRAVFVNRRKDGEFYHEEKTISPLKNAHGQITHYVSAGKDITARIAAEERLHHLAYHDVLTGLPNRLSLQERLSQSIAEAERQKRLVAVLFIDLDRFKNINDTLGHDIGDQLLVETANRLKSALCRGDTVARPGGDEFAIVLANLAQFDDVSRVVSQKIMERFHTPFLIAGHELFVTPSIGITLYPADGKEPDTLIKNADTAMYHAKDSGRNTFQFFTRELNLRMERQMALEMALRQALERHEFQLLFQPQVELATGGVIGVEALIRWRRDEELVSPLEFIPLAEDTGLIVPIGEWVMRNACTQAMAWRKEGLASIKVSVNLSPRQFREANLVPTIQNVLQETGLDPGRLVLEITEGVIMHKPEQVLEKLRQINGMGIGLAVDDFGTGYSSLGYLKRFPIDSLKIDRSFVQDIITEPDDAAIAQAVIRLSHSLGIEVVAEGVETEAQLAFLRSRGCNAMQGYYFSKPIPADEVARLLQENRRLALPAQEVPEAQRTLLIVDNEENIHKALAHVLRNEGYKILLASGPAQAFELLAQHPVGVILCDQRMPEMTGVVFLSRLKNLYPATVRIILSGYTDLESVSNALNHGTIYKFLTKPWEDDLLRANVREAFHRYSLEMGSSGQSAVGA